MNAKKIIFVTGTDTGVGKTLLAAHLLHHFRQTSIHTLAMKPFCSGGLSDVNLLQSLQPGGLTDAEMNPFYFAQPIAPLIAKEQRRKKIRLPDVLAGIDRVKQKCDCLIIEGSGGLLVPLGENFSVADLIAKLDCHVVVAARNQLGTINHTLLTINALQSFGTRLGNTSVVLMCGAMPDLSSRTNEQVIAKLVSPINVFKFPFLGNKASATYSIKAGHSKANLVLAKMLREFAKKTKKEV